MFQRPEFPRDQLKPAIVTIMTIESFARAGNNLVLAIGGKSGPLTNEIDGGEVVVTDCFYDACASSVHP